jgi:EAL domain-containing protein (putative c-di-GMP-specific phosphodiesterase class I)
MMNAILVVDDDPMVLRAHGRVIERGGYQVETVPDGAAAIAAIERRAFDAIVSDVDMPGMNGIRLLEQVRRRDLDVPVIFVTGAPSIDAASAAVEHGALRYLVKPVANDVLVKTVDDAVKMHAVARARRQALDLAGGLERLVGDHAGLVQSFERALDALWIAYQPIVARASGRVFAYEALVRSREPALPHPGALLDAAERLDRLESLGRAIRRRAIEPMAQLPDDALLFVNLHPRDLLDEALLDGDGAFAAVAGRVVLEITERAALDDLAVVRERIDRLRAIGFRIAIDDLGAGHASLNSFALLEPDVVKLDMALVRELHRAPTKQKLVRTMIAMCSELGITLIAEGIETIDERDCLAALGCDLMQGYLFARPGPAFPSVM